MCCLQEVRWSGQDARMLGMKGSRYRLKTTKAPGPSEVLLELIATSGGVGIQVMAKTCQMVLDGFGMPVEWALSIVVPLFKGKGDIWNCISY